MIKKRCKEHGIFIGKKGKCRICETEKEMACIRANLNEIKQQLEISKIQNAGLKKSLEEHQFKKRHPIWFRVNAVSFSCTEEYLTKLLVAIAPVADTIEIVWGRN